MTATAHIRAKITPWDDLAFVRAFEAAREEAVRSGFADGHRAAARVEQALRDAGYPQARVDVLRTVQEALEQTSHWIVTRDG